jgi:hypothetical protein
VISEDMEMEFEAENEMLVDTVETLMLYDRSASVKKPKLSDFNFLQRIGNGSFGNVSGTNFAGISREAQV